MNATLTSEGHTDAEVLDAMKERFFEMYPDETWNDGGSECHAAGAADWLGNGYFDEDDLPTLKALVDEWAEQFAEVMALRSR